MPSQLIPHVGASYASTTSPLSKQETINYYLDVGGAQRQPQALRAIPGTVNFCTSVAGACRGMGFFDGLLYVVFATTLYTVDSSGISTSRGNVQGSGPVYLDHNNNQVGIADRPWGVMEGFAFVPGTIGFLYVYNKTTHAYNIIADSSFPPNLTPGSGDYLSRVRGFYASPFADNFLQNTDSTGATKIWAFAQVETDSDYVLGLSIIHRNVVMFGSDTIEFYWFSGAGNQLLERQQGAVINRGVIHHSSILKGDDTILFVSNDLCVYKINVFDVVKVSNEPIEEFLQLRWTNTSSFVGFFHQWKGHKFYCFTIDDHETWCYDNTLPAEFGWTRRKSTDYEYWRLQYGIFAYGYVLVGGRNGKLYRLSDLSYTQDGDNLECIRISAYIHAEGTEFKLANLEFFAQTGVGNSDSINPTLSLQISRDYGASYSASRSVSLGAAGVNKRIFFRNCGNSTTHILIKTICRDPVKRDIIGCVGNIVGGV